MLLFSVNTTMTLENNRVLRIYLHRKNQWFLFLHDPFYSVSPTDWDGLQIDAGYSTGVTYAYQAFHLLESPFATNCKNYMSDTEYYSRKDCIRKCKLKHSTEECGVIADEVEVYKNEHSIRFPANQNESICAESLSLDRICLDECPHLDCVKMLYKGTKMAKLGFEHDLFSDTIVNRNIWVEIIIPREPETTFFHKPRIETVEFICYLASTVSLWFGLSMFSSLCSLSWFLSNFQIYLTLNQIKIFRKKTTLRNILSKFHLDFIH